MFKLDNEEAFLQAFRPKDRPLVELPADVRFPIIVRSYFAATHPAGGRVFLVFATAKGAPTGIVFDSNGAGPPVPHMCDWCHVTAPRAHTALLTTYVNTKRRVGVHVCSDLSCKDKLEEDADRMGRSAKPAIDMLVARMGRFASETLGIDLGGANR